MSVRNTRGMWDSFEYNDVVIKWKRKIKKMDSFDLQELYDMIGAELKIRRYGI